MSALHKTQQIVRTGIGALLCLSLVACGYESDQPSALADLGEVSPVQDARALDADSNLHQPVSGAPSASSTGKVDSVALLLDGLKVRLQQNADDVEGWVLLGKSYHHLGRWEDASASFEKAKLLGYTGAAPSLDETEPVRAMGRTSRSPLFAPIDRRNFFEGMKQPAPENREKTQESEQVAPGLKLRVRIESSLASKIPSDSTVFVFARSATGNLNSRAPLAATRRLVADLPADIRLDDSMAMTPAANISSASSVVVGARLALSGNPVKQPGDLEILSSPVSSSHGALIELTLVDNSATDSP